MSYTGNSEGQTFCGGYNAAGDLTYADALLIPSAKKADGTSFPASNFCGQGKAFVTGKAGTPGSQNQVCCKILI